MSVRTAVADLFANQLATFYVVSFLIVLVYTGRLSLYRLGASAQK